MAYAAVISLKQTIHHLLNSSHTSLLESSQEILKSAYKQATSVQQLLKELYGSNTRRSSQNRIALDVKIKEAAQKVEDALGFNVSNHFLSNPKSHGDMDFEEAGQEINSFIEKMKKLEEECTNELDNPSPLEDEDEDRGSDVPSNTDFSAQMVGLHSEFTEIKDHLLKPVRPYDFGVLSLVGKVGSCRTLAAKTLFDQIYVAKEHAFNCGAWVTIGRNYEFKEILVNILAQIDDHRGLLISEGDVTKLGDHLHASLKGRRYMIVVDDVEDVEVWCYLRNLFPVQDNGSLVLVTTGCMEVAQFASTLYLYEMPTFLDDYHIWDHLQLIMFGIQDSIHPEFEKAGKKIAKNCRGSRIALAKVMLFLFKADKTTENWSKLAAEEQHSVFMVDDEISEVHDIKVDKINYDKNLFVTNVIDLSPCINIIKDYLFPKRYFPKTEITTFYGMAGIGKTTLIKKVFEDLLISHHFNHRAWVTLGPNYNSEKILEDILAQIYPDVELVMDKRCLIVLDDLWSQEPLNHLKTLFPNIKGEILVTSRIRHVGLFGADDRVYNVRLLNKVESWDLFCEKMFAEELCPPELQKVGKKISENCEGLPLLILAVVNRLSKCEKTLEYWNMVAEKKNSVFTDAHEQILKVLHPSYELLPQYLKACFVYMGVFPLKYEIKTSKLIKLWVAEGFLEPNPSQTLEDFAVKCLKELVERSLVMVLQKGSDGKTTKTCSLHSVIWHLSNTEALKNKLFHALSIHSNDSAQSIKEQRRICVRNSVLLGFSDVHTSMRSASNTRSILCTGPPHRYPVPISFRSRLLRVLNACSIRLYAFPAEEVVELIHLRYLALTCSDRLPASISKLRNLDNLIIRRHLSTQSSRDSSFLPKEIWSMKELKYLRATGSVLPDPNSDDVLTNLETLLDVSIDSCTKDVLKGLPNLKRLGVQIELEPGDDNKPFHHLNHISNLSNLESLKCVVVNPEFSCNLVTPIRPHSMFPPSLRKLSLSGLGYPWSYMSIVGRLPNLEVLKLRRYAFRGQVWETEYVSFSNLKFLLIEDTDLVRWSARNPSFFSLKYLKIKHCYMLEELLHFLPHSVEMLEVVDCSPSVVNWAEEMKEIELKRKLEKLTVHVHSTWGDQKMLP